MSVNHEKLDCWYVHFQRNHQELFTVKEEEMDVNSDSNQLETRPKKKPNLTEMREKLLCKRTVERFTDYEGLMLT